MYRIIGYLLLCALCLMGAWEANRLSRDTTISNEVIGQVSSALAKQMAIVEKEAEIFLKKEVWKSTYPIFLMNGSRVTRWTDNSFLPDFSLFRNSKGWQEFNHSQGIYLVYAKELSSGLQALALLPIYRHFKVNNRRQQSEWNTAIFKEKKLNLLLSISQSGTPVKVKGHTFFRVDTSQPIYKEKPCVAVISFGLLSVFFCSLVIAEAVGKLHRAQKYFHVIAIVLPGYLLVRMTMLFTNFPGRWQHGSLFNLPLDTSSAGSHSVGDLLSNTLILLFPILYLSRISAKLHWKVIVRYAPPIRIGFAAALFFIGYIGFLIPYLIIRTIFYSSTIVLDINFSPAVNALTGVAFVTLLLGTCVGFLTSHLAVRRISRSGLRPVEILISILVAGIFILLFFFVSGREFYIPLGVGTAYFVLLVATGLYRTIRVTRTVSILYLLVAFFAHSAQFALSLKYFYTENQRQAQKRLAIPFSNDEALSYAFFAGNKRITAFGEYKYEHDFDRKNFADSALFTSGSKEDKFLHAAVGANDKVLIVSDKIYRWSYMVASFSFVYLGYLLLLFIWLLWRGVAHLFKELELPYSDRIQTFSFVLLSVPLLVLGLSVMRQMGDAAESQIRETYKVKSSLLGDAVVTVMENPEFKDNQLASLTLLARSSNINFSVYDITGNLKEAAQPTMHESPIVSRLINPKAFLAIREKGTISVLEEEKMGSLMYSNFYRQLKSTTTGNIIGILSIPFFESQHSFDRKRDTVFISVMITFTFVLTIFLLLSIWAARWLTYPLRWITEILRRTSLRENKKMDWEGKDEIGVMLNEYNKLVDKLEVSKVELARNQKEKAWREIAQQVAHEIKNPLTPMKLTLQQMENQIIRKEFQEKKGLIIITNLLDQVTILDEIASSFSSFAKMPMPVTERVELTSIVSQTVNLYMNDKRGIVHLICPYAEIYCMGDALLLIRVFSNILLNALQSSAQGKVEVIIEVKRMVKDVAVSITDNGNGIEEDAQKRIFLPHFTTKKSGSGLGLAICKQGVEQMNGRIWCTSEINVGTTFYVVLPMGR